MPTIGILTAGGDCPGLNAVIRAVVKNALRRGWSCLGFLDGYAGLVEDRFRPLGRRDVSGILTRGGTILGASNKDDPFRYLDPKTGRRQDRHKDALATLKGHGAEVLVVIGGDGSMSVASRLARKGAKVVGVPKTIDNDLWGTEQTFGFDTAVGIATEAIDRIHTTADAHHRVMVVEVMGRTAGWIALASGIAAGADLILIPEIPFHWKKLPLVVEQRKEEGKSSTIVVVAEGAAPKGGSRVVARRLPGSPEPERLGGVGAIVARRIEEMTGSEARGVVLGHILRGGSPSPLDRILATRFGVHAVELIAGRRYGRMVALKDGEMASTPLSLVGGRTRRIPLNSSLLHTARSMGVLFGD